MLGQQSAVGKPSQFLQQLQLTIASSTPSNVGNTTYVSSSLSGKKSSIGTSIAVGVQNNISHGTVQDLSTIRGNLDIGSGVRHGGTVPSSTAAPATQAEIAAAAGQTHSTSTSTARSTTSPAHGQYRE